MILRHTVQYPGRRGPLIDGLVKAKGCSIFFWRGDGLGQILPQMRMLFHPNRGSMISTFTLFMKCYSWAAK